MGTFRFKDQSGMGGASSTDPDGLAEYYTHRRMWAAANTLHTHAQMIDSPAFYLPAMLLARLTVESYCNFAMSALDPSAFSCQKLLFNDSTAAKAHWIYTLMGMKVRIDARPFQTLLELDELRDKIVQPERQSFEIEHTYIQEQPFYFTPDIDQLFAADRCHRAFVDVDKICQKIHEKMLARLPHPERLANLGDRALTGATFSQSVLGASH